ncbi:MAG: acyltransferase [Terracidiphilus sp.]
MKVSTEIRKPVTDASVHLDAVRGLAAIWVVLGHCREFFIQTSVKTVLIGKNNLDGASPSIYQAPASQDAYQSVWTTHLQINQIVGGFQHHTIALMAVIVFFVLSGYLVGGSVLRTMRRGIFSWKKYFFQRLTRLWMVLVPALFLGAAWDGCGKFLLHRPLSIYQFGPTIAPEMLHNFTFSAFFGSLFFLQGIATNCFGTNGPLWSLSYEMWYYIFFPLMMTALWASKRTGVRIFAALLLIALLLISGWRLAAYFILWLMGAALSLAPLRLPARLRKIFIAASGILLLSVMLLSLIFPINLVLSNLILGVFVSFFLWTLLHAQEVSVHPLYRRAAQNLSHMSYTLYLVHFPFLVFIAAVLLPAGTFWAFSAGSLLKIFVIILAVLVYARLVYLCFERNTDRVRHWLTQHGVG